MDVGIDLGSSHIRVYVKGKGIVLSEATAVSYDAYTGEIIAMGNSAFEMLERCPQAIKVVRPIKGGVIANFSVVTQILSRAIEKISSSSIFRPNVIISAPGSCTALERKTIIDSACAAGAGRVSIIDQPVASALGVGLGIEKPYGVMMVDIGSGTSDIAVITMGTIAAASSLKVAGDSMDEAICRYVRKEKGIVIGTRTAENIKRTVGCATVPDEEMEMSANGKDFVSGMPVMFTITSSQVSQALSECLQLILNEMRRVFDEIPDQMYTDICTGGIELTGGGSRLRGIDKLISDFFSIKARVNLDGENCAAKGAGYALKDIKRLTDYGYIHKQAHDAAGIDW